MAAVLLGACGNRAVPGEAGGGASHLGLQYPGSIAIVRMNADRVELSAPLFPDSGVFERFQGTSEYPKTDAKERVRLIDEDVRTYEQLLTLCAPFDPAIKVRQQGDPELTIDEIRKNYDAVARCAYMRYGAKPYWVPQHLNDVDACGRKLGPGWHLPTEAEIATFTEADFQLFQDTLTALPGKDWFPVEWYYRLDIYLRGGDGALKLGNLAPMVPHVQPLPISGTALNALYLGDGHPIGVRCLSITAAGH